MEKKRGKWLIAVLILVLAAACAGGFYLVKSRSRKENGQFPGGGQMPGDIPGGQSTGITATGTAILKVSQDSAEEAGEELDTKLQEAQDAVTDAEAVLQSTRKSCPPTAIIRTTGYRNCRTPIRKTTISFANSWTPTVLPL